MRQRLAITSLASAWLALASAAGWAQQCDRDGDGQCGPQAPRPPQFCTDSAGNKGSCSQRTYSCPCIPQSVEARDVAVRNAYEASRAILQLEDLFLALDPEDACGSQALAGNSAITVPPGTGLGLVDGQLLELTADLGFTLERLQTLGPVGRVTPETYGQVDKTIRAIARIPSIAALCSITVPVGDLKSGYVDYKRGLELQSPNSNSFE